MMEKLACIYDFDKTLCTKDMQEYSLIPHLGYKDPSIFWKEVAMLSDSQKMDKISAYLYWLKVKYEEAGNPLKRDAFLSVGNDIQLYKGVDTWFERINAYGKSKGLEVEHYIISSGMEEIITSTSIAKEFKKIYACRYYYDERNIAQWPALIVNYTTKTQYVFRINKQVLDESNDDDLNAYVKPQERPIPFSRMIYIADGLTDVPCMKLVKSYGGYSVAVYNPDSGRAALTANHLLEEGRADYLMPADYRKGKPMEALVTAIIDSVSCQVTLSKCKG